MYSLWAVPTGSIRHKLQRIIESLEGPCFVPHATIVGPIDMDISDIIQRAQSFAQGQKRFFIKFQDVACEKEAYYRCVFLSCAKTAELIKAHKFAADLFNMRDDSFNPHVSLIYSEMNEEQRWETVNQLKKRFYEGEKGKEDDMLYENGFWVEELELWKISPENKGLENWEITEKFQLTKT